MKTFLAVIGQRFCSGIESRLIPLLGKGGAGVVRSTLRTNLLVEPPLAPPLPRRGIRRAYRHLPLHTKFAASLVSPVPLYCATCGYGHNGRVLSTTPFLRCEAGI